MSDILNQEHTHGHDEEHIALPPTPQPSRRFLFGVSGTIVAVLLIAFVAGLVPRIRRSAALENDALRLASAKPVVQVAKPKVRPPSGTLVLPGSVQPLQETTIYARTNGYLKRWLVDIGDEVKEGQLLAEIDTPELDQDLRASEAAQGEAKAALEQSKTRLELARVNLKRVNDLATSGYSSQQDRDEKEATFHVEQSNILAAQARVATQEANLSKLRQLKAFSRVTAPFSGVITYRSTEVGSLVTSGNGAGQALFKLSRYDIVRVYVSIPQSHAGNIKQKLETNVTVRELADRQFVGTVTRTAKALDMATRTMLAEVQVRNADHTLLPGMYVQTRFTVPKTGPQLVVPVSSLLNGADGMQVAVVDASERIHLQSVQLGDDYGTEVAIASGLTGEERVVMNPSDKVIEGVAVAIQQPEPKREKSAQN